MSQTWRRNSPVLVTEAHTLGSLAIIRSLGRAGYPVHACSRNPDAMGFFSSFSNTRVLCPDYWCPEFLGWLRQYIREHRIRVMIPSEDFLLAIRNSYSEFSPLLPLSSSAAVVYSGMSKADQFEAFTKGPLSAMTQEHLPPFRLLKESNGALGSETLEGLGLPLYIKVDGCHASARRDSRVHMASSVSQALELLQDQIPQFKKILIEGHVPGRGAGVFFLLWRGQLLAEFMHLRLHEVPRTGGVSSYRKSWWHQAIRDDAFAKLRAMAWQGVAMMEYRWDPETDQFHFLEMNGRFWGSLHLALHAGVDFPTLLLDAFHGHPPSPVTGPSGQACCRYTFPRDLMYVWSTWKDSGLGWCAKLGSALEFFLLGLDPRVRSDLWFPGDRMLYWRQVGRFLKEAVQSLWGRSLPSRYRAMRDSAKRGFLFVCKWLGLFQVARFLTRRGLRILCYHGFALSDEDQFRPKLFMRPEIFRKRMQYLSTHAYPVLSLDHACEGLASGRLPDDAIVITIDDGFHSVFRCASPILRELSFAATIYVTSYYSVKQKPIFRLAVQYMFWKTKENRLDVTGLGLALNGVLPLQPEQQKNQTMWEIIRFAEHQLEEEERCTLASELGRRLGVAYTVLQARRNLSLMNPDEIHELAKVGMDIQLHTHRHQLPEQETLAEREIQQNREFLEPLVGRKLRHFCYPSGIWSKRHWPWLESLGIATATTCDPGLNYSQTPRLGLQRFLDGENISHIEFEAELSGFSELLRSARAIFHLSGSSRE